MLLIENKKGIKVYTIKNKYLCENGVLNEKNVCNACMKYMKRKNVGGVENEKDMYNKLLEVYESGLNNWIEVFEKDNHKTKKEKHRINHCKRS